MIFSQIARSCHDFQKERVLRALSHSLPWVAVWLIAIGEAGLWTLGIHLVLGPRSSRHRVCTSCWDSPVHHLFGM